MALVIELKFKLCSKYHRITIGDAVNIYRGTFGTFGMIFDTCVYKLLPIYSSLKYIYKNGRNAKYSKDN